MASVWKRLQRVNKRANKFSFTVSYHELKVEATSKWRPTSLQMVMTRRSRRVVSSALAWNQFAVVDPLVGTLTWAVPDNQTISVTLFKDARTHEMEDKNWIFVLEDVGPLGKKRALASASINMRKYASLENFNCQQTFVLQLRPVTKKITAAEIELTISCVFLREGKATDEDMQSMISLMSQKHTDIANIDDLEELEDETGDISLNEHVIDFTQQLEQLTSSLNSPEAQTPLSVPSITEDPVTADSNNFLKEPTPPQVSEIDAKLSGTASKAADTTDTTTASKTYEAVIQKLEPIDKKLPAGNLFHTFNFKDSKPAPLASPEQDKISEQIQEPKQLVQKLEIKKRIELEPLNLKKNYDCEKGKEISKSEPEKLQAGTVNRDKTPGQDLLAWCIEVTEIYENIKITNLTTSFKNGMAFAAIIARHRPELIDLDALNPTDIVGNCKKAFEAGEKLGIPKVIEPSDMSLLAVPDKLAVLTYLYQLHAYFTGNAFSWKCETLPGPTKDESSYVIGSFRSDSLSSSSIHDIKSQLMLQRHASPIIESNYMKSPTPKFEELACDDDGSAKNNKMSPPKELTSPPAVDNKIVNRHKQQSEKARELIEKLRNENGKSIDIDECERQTRLREHARRLIAETRAKSTNLDSPSSPITQRVLSLSPERTISPINNNSFNFNAMMPSEEMPRSRISSNILERISPKVEKLEKTKFIQSELDLLEREMLTIDEQANELEKKLRAVMVENVISNEAETEDQLMAQWFTLVNKKNALLRRQMQLNLLEQESDLERKYDVLNLELRAAMSVEDWRKTEEQREREKKLLSQLLSIVDKRNELVLNLHSQEQAIEDDEDIQKKLVNVDINHKEKCSIM